MGGHQEGFEAMATKTIEKKTTKKPAAKKTAAPKTAAPKAGLVKTKKIAYYIHYVPDMTKAVEFFKTIGLEPGFTSPEWSEFDAGIKFALHGPCKDDCGTYEAKETGLCFDVTSAKGACETFKSLGVKVTSEPHQVCEEGYAFNFQDPFGNTFSAYGKL
jgi:predicted enzyme related to lactoylglutathione lyase